MWNVIILIAVWFKVSSSVERITFSGIQPTSIPHIGNYFGAIKQWVDIQEKANYEKNSLIISIVDLHAITSPKEANTLK